MPTYNGKPYSSTRNLNLKQGLLAFARTQTTNPIPSTANGLYIDSNNNLVYSKQGTAYVIATNP